MLSHLRKPFPRQERSDARCREIRQGAEKVLVRYVDRGPLPSGSTNKWWIELGTSSLGNRVLRGNYEVDSQG